jgi:hypothetical protein
VSDEHDVERRLFEAGREERPGAQLRQRLLDISIEPPRRTWVTAWRLRFTVSAAAALAVGAVLLWTVRREAPRLAAEPSAARPEAAPASPALASTTEARHLATPAPASSSVASSSVASSSVALDVLANEAPRRASPAEPKAAATLSVELDSLRRAREALAAGNTAGALRELDRYEDDLNGRQLRAEAALLRIETLAQRGETAAASARAKQFVEQYPHSPLVDRARTFLTPSAPATAAQPRVPEKTPN